MLEQYIPTTAQYIDTDYGNWYDQGLPAVLEQQFPDGLALPESVAEFEGQEFADFETMLCEVMVAAHEPENAYHNVAHAQRVTENAFDGYDALATRCNVYIPQGFLQPVLFGTAGHDLGNPGTTFFADADSHRIPDGASADMAVERYSAEKVAEYLTEKGASPEQAAVAAYVPSASAYGAHEPTGQQLGIERAANPVGIAGRMMRAVDVVPAEGASLSFADDTAVIFGEKRPGGQQPSREMRVHLAGRVGFLQGYVLPQFDKLDEAVGTDLTAYVGWRGRVERQLAQVESMRRGESAVARAILRSQTAAKYAVELV